MDINESVNNVSIVFKYTKVYLCGIKNNIFVIAKYAN